MFRADVLKMETLSSSEKLISTSSYKSTPLYNLGGQHCTEQLPNAIQEYKSLSVMEMLHLLGVVIGLHFHILGKTYGRHCIL
jgi:hypothetical protein